MNPAQPPRPRRAALAAELRRLRTMAGVTQRDMAKATGMSQPTVYRAENGLSVPSWPEVRAWAQATEAVGPDLEKLGWMTEAAVGEPVRLVRKPGALTELQEGTADLERSARTQHVWNNGFVPGLLQTAPYAQAVIQALNLDPDITAVVSARLRRQQILYEPGRHLEFLITAAALDWRTGPDFPLAGQLEHLVTVAALETVDLGIIPPLAAWRVVPPAPFALYGDRSDGEPPVVVVETLTSAQNLKDDEDVARFAEVLALLRQSALRGEDAVAFVRETLARER